MPVLYSWSFYCSSEEFDFKTVFERLDAGALQLPEIKKDSLPEELLNLMKLGYGPVDHQLRDGSSTVSFFTAALSAHIRKKESGMTPSDEWGCLAAV